MKVKSKIDVSKLKSAEIIEDFDEIWARLSKSLEESLADPGNKSDAAKMHTRLTRRDSDGATEIRKSSSLSLASRDAQRMMPDKSKLPALVEGVGMPWKEEYAERVVPYWASDERVDAHGDIVVQEWDFAEFADNPVMPWSHAWSAPPVGNAIHWEIRTRAHGDYNGPALWLLGLFALESDYAWAGTIFNLVSARFLRAGSVGFVSNRVIDIRDEAEREALGLGRFGYVLEDNALFEFSPCTLGANSGALVDLARAKMRGKLDAKGMSFVRELARQRALLAEEKDGWREEDDRYLRMAKQLFPQVEWTPHKNIEEPFDAGDDLVLRGYQPGWSKDAAEATADERLDEIAEMVEGVAAAVESMSSMIVESMELVVETQKELLGELKRLKTAAAAAAGESEEDDGDQDDDAGDGDDAGDDEEDSGDDDGSKAALAARVERALARFDDIERAPVTAS